MNLKKQQLLLYYSVSFVSLHHQQNTFLLEFPLNTVLSVNMNLLFTDSNLSIQYILEMNNFQISGIMIQELQQILVLVDY